MPKCGILPSRVGDDIQVSKSEQSVIVKINGELFELTRKDALKLAGEIITTFEVMEIG